MPNGGLVIGAFLMATLCWITLMFICTELANLLRKVSELMNQLNAIERELKGIRLRIGEKQSGE